MHTSSTSSAPTLWSSDSSNFDEHITRGRETPGLFPYSRCLRIARHLRVHARPHRSCAARIIDHMVNGPQIAQRHRDHVVEPHLRSLRRLDRPRENHIRLAKYAVDSQPPGLMSLHMVRHLV